MSRTLYIRDQRGSFIPAGADVVIDAAKTHMSRRVRRGTVLSSPHLVRDFLCTRLGRRDCEYFVVLTLDVRHRMIDYTELCRGTIDGAAVYPREVVKLALDKGAASVILAHNHPSGVTEPSAADQLITKRLQEALALLDIRVTDHLVIAGGDAFSFAQSGLL